MFLTVHATAGAAVGALAGGPIGAFLLGVLSHAVIDIIPHGDEQLAPPCGGATCTHRDEVRFLIRIAAIDGVVMLGVLAALLQPWVTLPSWAVLAGIAGGVLPDVMQGLGSVLTRSRFFTGFKRVHDYIHVDIIPFETPVLLGMLTQLAALTFFAGAYLGLS
ncbi:MAG: hypothetical protein Q7T01_04690 [bacterium]|nr:hypothetical protein [bacterium]